MSTLSDIKKRLGLSTTLPLGSAGGTPLTGAHLHSHSHGPGCGCSHSHDEDEDEE
ncbi:MAG: hypothetical protein LRZ85_01990 [Alphaproteobacteria bacterium]|nr:hypothetical protein [Alphaproteobacteria bacterium]MCD8570996.1 hypothetical protein [Alphaproteobacteria bacterium]